jgi:hypothetical protein
MPHPAEMAEPEINDGRSVRDKLASRSHIAVVSRPTGGTMISRGVAAAVLVLLWTTVLVACQATQRHPVNLNRPGALRALEQSNPPHYEKVRQILEGVVRQPVGAVPGWIQTTFDAQNAHYSLMLLTSSPPKRRLSFTLDETRYQAVVTLTDVRAVILPSN